MVSGGCGKGYGSRKLQVQTDENPRVHLETEQVDDDHEKEYCAKQILMCTPETTGTLLKDLLEVKTLHEQMYGPVRLEVHTGIERSPHRQKMPPLTLPP